MKLLVFVVLVLDLVLIHLVASFGFGGSHPRNDGNGVGMPGGWSVVDLNRLQSGQESGVTTAAEKAVELMSSANGEPLIYTRIVSAKTQVVAGVNYELELEVPINGKSEICLLRVSNLYPWLKNGGQWSVETELPGDPCEPFIPQVRKTRAAPLLGGEHEADKNNDMVQKAAQWALEHINEMSNSMYRQGLMEISHATQQVINGFRYHFILALVSTSCRNKPENKHKALDECPVSDDAKPQDCDVSVIYSQGKFSMENYKCKAHKDKPVIGGDDHDYKPHGNKILGGDDHDYKPHGILGGDDHDYKPHGILGGDDHDYKPHGILGGDDHDYKPHGILGGDDHDYKPHGILGGGDHDYKPHGILGGDDHDYKPHGNKILGGDDHDYKPHGQRILGGDDHDYKPHGQRILGGDDHDYKPHSSNGLLGQDLHDYIPHVSKIRGLLSNVRNVKEDALSFGTGLLKSGGDAVKHMNILGGDTHDYMPHGKCAEHVEAFKEFKSKHMRVYGGPKEEAARFQIFCDNMEKIKAIRQVEQGSAQYGATQFADLSEEEFKKTYLGLKPEMSALEWPTASIPDGPIPESWDWRDHGAVTPVKNQGSCGSCWAFSTTGNIEGQWAIKGKEHKLVSLSEQELVDCDKVDEGCNGGLPSQAYEAIMKLGGIETEGDYKYEGHDEKCKFDKSEVVVKLTGAVNISQNEDEMAAWLYKNGPISIGINAFAMQFYFGGIAHPWKFFCNPKSLDHGVLIVGYGKEGDEPYWIIKNSWGPSWGREGYYYVYRGDGTCGLNTMCTSATVV